MTEKAITEKEIIDRINEINEKYNACSIELNSLEKKYIEKLKETHEHARQLIAIENSYFPQVISSLKREYEELQKKASDS